MKKIILLFFVTAFYSLSFSQESEDRWIYVGSYITGKIYVTDVKPSASSEKSFDFWTKTINPPKKVKNKKGVWVNKENGHVIYRGTMYCDSKKYQLPSYREYNSKGEVISYEEGLTKYYDVFPDSAAEDVLDFVCKDNKELKD